MLDKYHRTRPGKPLKQIVAAARKLRITSLLATPSFQRAPYPLHLLCIMVVCASLKPLLWHYPGDGVDLSRISMYFSAPCKRALSVYTRVAEYASECGRYLSAVHSFIEDYFGTSYIRVQRGIV